MATKKLNGRAIEESGLLASDSARKFACEGHPLFSVTAQMR
jgi:hypothetical protein